MVTGAADGMLKVWKAGACKATVKAHSQSIRDLVVISRIFEEGHLHQPALGIFFPRRPQVR